MAQTLPKVSIPRTKSTRDQFWLNHLRALHEQDQPLSAYAEAHGLSPGSLYRARARLRGRGLVSEPEPVYAREGIGHLWLIDPVYRTLEAFELHEGQWLLIASAKDDDPISIQPFDAITFSLGDLWP